MAALAALTAVTFTACEDDNDSTGGGGQGGQGTALTEGVYLVCSGNTSNQIGGSLTLLGLDGTSATDIFEQANGRALGDTPNDVMAYGGKLYVAVTGENTLEVINRYNLSSTQLSTTALMGDARGKNPRRLTAAGKYVFLSTFDGYVAKIDTLTLEAEQVYQVGSYPEGMAVGSGLLFVANSDYGAGQNPSLSSVNLADGTVTTFKDALITNPTSIACYDDALYVLDYGWYDDAWNQNDAGVRRVKEGQVEIVADATMMAADPQRGLIYTVNAPYTSPATPVTYGVYDMKTGQSRQFIAGDGIDSPAAITVDEVSGDVYIASYTMNPDTGYADYSAPSYVNQYTAEGTLVRTFEAGVGPTAFAVSYGTSTQK